MLRSQALTLFKLYPSPIISRCLSPVLFTEYLKISN